MDNNEEVKLTEQPQPTQVQVDSPVPIVESNMKMSTVIEGEEEQKKKKKKKWPIVVIIIILLLIVCGLVAWYLLVYSKTNKVETKTKEVKSEYRMTGNNIQNFDLAFMKLENKEENKVYSPLSIKYALQMLSEGSDENTKQEIDAVIGDYTSQKYTNNEHMSFANAMFIRDTFKDAVKESYVTKLKENYDAEIRYEDFNSVQPMNEWVSEKTFKLIKDMFDDVSEDNFILINALAIDMNWKNRIQAANAPLPEGMKQLYYNVNYVHEKYNDYIHIIEDDYPSMKFNNQENIKSVEVGASFNHYDIVKDKGENNIRKTVTDDYTKYLNENPEAVEYCPPVDEYVNQYIKDINTNYKEAATSTDFYISDNDNVKVFAKDLQTYDGTTLQYVGIMPKNEELTTYVKNLKVKDLTKILESLKEVKYDNFKEGVITQIRGNIPLFKYEYELKLVKDLNKLNIKDAFKPGKADLTGMIEDSEQYIGDASHKAMIEFSNDGIKAAAATAISGMGAAGACNYDYEFDVPIEKIDITFDKPYMYIIRDKNSGEVWFTGTVYEPTKK